VVPELVEFTFLDQTAVVACQADTTTGFQLSNVVFNGTAVAQFRAPIQSGTYAVAARLTQTGITLESVITVAAPNATIPATGAGDSSRSLALVATGLAAAGIALVMMARKRRRPAPVA
jgi:LPXTG-motif cell wall-anchored protein